jgi:hypothetical protein
VEKLFFNKGLRKLGDTSLIRNDTVSCVKDPSDSLTKEFLQAVESARTASELEPPPIDPDSIEAQPEAIRVLWDGVTHLAVDDPLVHTRAGICITLTFAVVIHLALHCWLMTSGSGKPNFAATWVDKVRNRQDLTFAIVHPDPEDCSTGILA